MSVGHVNGVESVRPERGRHDYSFLLQDEAILNDEFLAEVPVVVECFGAFLSGRRPPFMYHFLEFAWRWVLGCLIANLLKLYR